MNPITDLPEGVQYLIWKKYFTLNVVGLFEHKDWWWHTVKCRSDGGLPGFLDPEFLMGGEKYFCKNY
jgi:hypothetical protein